jgi:hypothetical protein
MLPCRELGNRLAAANYSTFFGSMTRKMLYDWWRDAGAHSFSLETLSDLQDTTTWM